MTIFFSENAFEYIAYKMSAILYLSRCFKANKLPLSRLSRCHITNSWEDRSVTAAGAQIDDRREHARAPRRSVLDSG